MEIWTLRGTSRITQIELETKKTDPEKMKYEPNTMQLQHEDNSRITEDTKYKHIGRNLNKPLH